MPIAAFCSEVALGIGIGTAPVCVGASVGVETSCAATDPLDVAVVKAPLEWAVADKGLRWYAWFPCVPYNPRNVSPNVVPAAERTS